jgi:hypothetical protein
MKLYQGFFAFILIAGIAACSSSVTNVYDYYIKNNVEKHIYGQTTESKSKLLYRKQESVNKSQLELVAFTQDSTKYLVIGSHKVAKPFMIYDSLYHFDVSDLYNRVRGNDFIRQLGDLSIFFAHIPAENCELFLSNWPDIKNKYMKAQSNTGEVVYIDYAFAHGIYFSFPKKSYQAEPTSCDIWVGKRKHNISMNDLLKAFGELKAFK